MARKAASFLGIFVNGHPFALRCTVGGTTTNYYYITNLQGDVLGMITGDRQSVASYSYDPYGKLLDTPTDGTIAAINPLRYRGYYYDAETGFYYLQSRYYDPSACRFINADIVIYSYQELGSNLFAYCSNCPPAYADFSGLGKIYVIYYDDEEGGFEDQAYNSSAYSASDDDVIFVGVTTAQEFVDAWNNMSGDIDEVFLYIHGGEGVLYFDNSELGFNGDLSFADLKEKPINKMVSLLSCKGGRGYEGNNVAWMFAKLTGSYVRACTGSVSYTKFMGKYYPRKAFDLGGFLTFYYGKQFVFFGKEVAKCSQIII